MRFDEHVEWLHRSLTDERPADTYQTTKNGCCLIPHYKPPKVPRSSNEGMYSMYSMYSTGTSGMCVC